MLGAVPLAAEAGLSGQYPDPGRGSILIGQQGLEEFSGEELREIDGEGRCMVTGEKRREVVLIENITSFCTLPFPEILRFLLLSCPLRCFHVLSPRFVSSVNLLRWLELFIMLSYRQRFDSSAKVIGVQK